MDDQLDSEWITAQEVADMLRVSIRHAYRYGEDGDIVIRRIGRRIEFSRASAEELAAKLNVDIKPITKPPKTDLLPASELLDYLKEVQNRLDNALLTIGRLQGQLDQRLLPDDEHQLKQRLAETETARTILQQQLDTAQAELERLKRPWWKRLLGE